MESKPVKLLSHLADLGSGQKITKKKAKFELLQIIKQLDKDDVNIESLHYSLSRLYSHFLPPIKRNKHAWGNDFDWAQQATLKRPTSKYYSGVLCFVRILKSGFLIGADGKRLHWVRTEMEEGSYNSDRVRISTVSKLSYPNALDIINDFRKYKVACNVIEVNDVSELETEFLFKGKVNEIKVVKFPLPEVGKFVYVNYDFVIQAIGGRVATVYVTGKDKPVDFVMEGIRRAKIMPILPFDGLK